MAEEITKFPGKAEEENKSSRLAEWRPLETIFRPTSKNVASVGNYNSGIAFLLR